MVVAPPRDGRATTEHGEVSRRWPRKRTPVAAKDTFTSAIRRWPDTLDGGANNIYENIAKGSVEYWAKRSGYLPVDEGVPLKVLYYGTVDEGDAEWIYAEYEYVPHIKGWLRKMQWPHVRMNSVAKVLQ